MSVRLLDAGTSPCQMRKTHVPEPVRTQSHHRWPSYLQRRLWGEERLDERLNLCGTDHDSLHTWISVLLGEQYTPTQDPGWLIRAEANRVMAWYREEQEKASLGYGEGSYGRGPYGSEQWDGIE